MFGLEIVSCFMICSGLYEKWRLENTAHSWECNTMHACEIQPRERGGFCSVGCRLDHTAPVVSMERNSEPSYQNTGNISNLSALSLEFQETLPKLPFHSQSHLERTLNCGKEVLGVCALLLIHLICILNFSLNVQYILGR